MVKDEADNKTDISRTLKPPHSCAIFLYHADSIEDDDKDEEAILGRKQGAMLKVNHTIF